ncbi:hypothetical protein JCM33374_g6620 [Metschnikowia sp. JCM 33374]|nr:hypothetical protein JCM33374_g6620 [Metschnikowia sp. JCM 33374]
MHAVPEYPRGFASPGDRHSHHSSSAATPQPATAKARPTSEGGSGSPSVNNGVREESVSVTSPSTSSTGKRLADVPLSHRSMIEPNLSLPEASDQSSDLNSDYF